MAYEPNDFITRHLFVAYATIKAIPVINGAEKVEFTEIDKIVVDTLALPGANVFYAAYLKLDGKQIWPEVTSSEAGTVSTMRFESRPDGLGIAKLTGSGGGLAPTPCGWKHEVYGLYTESKELKTVVIPAGGLIGLVGQQFGDGFSRFGFSVDGTPQQALIRAGGSASPTHTVYRIDDSGVIYTDDVGGTIALTGVTKGIFLVSYNSEAYKYLILQAPSDSEMTLITTNEIVQVVEVTS